MIYFALKCITAPIILAASAYMLFGYIRQRSAKEMKNIICDKSTVLFFTNANVTCRKYCLAKKITCSSNCSLAKLRYIVNMIDNAKYTLDICIYLITCNDLTYAIIRAYKRGILVRVIIDEEMASSTESKIPWFIDAGIPVRSKKSNILMHHKFCIIDEKTNNRKLLTGSLNWTLQGLAGNYEYVTITSHPTPVLEYQKEFNTLWNFFDSKI